MTGESCAERQHVCEIPRFGVELPVRIAAPGTTGPALEEKLLRRRGQSAHKILRAIHAVDRVLDSGCLHCEAFARRVPRTDDVIDAERQRVTLHQRCDLLLLLLHRREERQALLTRKIAG